MKDFNKLAQLIRILNEQYSYKVIIEICGKFPTFYIENLISKESGFLFSPGFSMDEVEGLVDFIYKIIDVLDNEDPLHIVGTHERITYLKWKI